MTTNIGHVPERGNRYKNQGRFSTMRGMKHSPGFLRIVEDAKARVRETDVATVLARLKKGEKLLLVDVREDNEWAKGHVAGAVHLGKGVIERDAETALPNKDAEVILYCGGGFRSALAADNLQKMGYTRVLSMDGGWRGWTEAGGPTEK
jgi:rhodanese-related sulfurtransferase